MSSFDRPEQIYEDSPYYLSRKNKSVQEDFLFLQENSFEFPRLIVSVFPKKWEYLIVRILQSSNNFNKPSLWHKKTT